MEYSELYEKAKALKPDVDEDIRAITKQSLEENMDRRELCLKIVEYLANNILSINTPTVILFLAPPYCPRNTLKREIPEEGALLDSVVDLLNQLGQEMGEELKMICLLYTSIGTLSMISTKNTPNRSRMFIQRPLLPQFFCR